MIGIVAFLSLLLFPFAPLVRARPLFVKKAIMSTTAGQPAVDPKWAAENNLTRVLVLTGVFHVSALICVGLRLFVRLGLLRSLGKDDFVIVLAAVRTEV